MNSGYKENISKIEECFNIFGKSPWLSLLLIGISAIVIRLIFFQNELIFSSDNLSYFKYALDVSLTGELPTSIHVSNNGWPLFISIFFNFFESKNFIEYMNLQSYLSMIISTITIIPLYFLAKKFTSSSFALISTILFIFEPRIIQNSLTGLTDPLFILLIVTSITLILQKNKYIIYGACISIAFATVVRVEGLFLIPALLIIFLIKNKITKKNIIQCIIFIIIIYLILLPFSIQRIENTGNDHFTGRIIIESQMLTENNTNGLELKMINSFYLLLQFLGKLMIPYLVIFVPLGVILFLKEKNIQKLILIIPGLFLIIPSLYAYTLPILDSRYLFPILPILCVIGVFSCKIYLEKTKYKKIIVTIIIIFIITSSCLFLNYKNTNVEEEQELIKLANIVNNNTDVILFINSPIFAHLDAAKLAELEEFPVTSSHYNANSTVWISLDFDVEDFFINMEKNKITHIVIDEEIDKPDILRKVFDNYEQDQNLKKIFDSKKEGYDYQMKIFEINYN